MKDKEIETKGQTYTFSPMGHTWIFDIDGTIVRHNGYRTREGDRLLEGAAEFFEKLPKQDKVILLTSRTEDKREATELFLKKHGIHYDYILFGLPFGERILVNDRKPSGLQTAYAINTERDLFIQDHFVVDERM